MAVPPNASGAGTDTLGVTVPVSLSGASTGLLVVSDSSALGGVDTEVLRVADPLSLKALECRTKPGRITKALPRSLKGTGSLGGTIGTLSFSLSLLEDTLRFPSVMKAEETLL